MSESEKILEIINDLADNLEALAVKLKHDTVDLVTGRTQNADTGKLAMRRRSIVLNCNTGW